MSFVLETTADFLYELAPYPFPLQPSRESALEASWFLSPRQHALELLLFAPINLALAVYFTRKAYNASFNYLKSQVRLYKSTWSDTLVTLMLALSVIAVCAYKTMRSALPFLLQPCHVQTISFFFIFGWLRPSDVKAHFIFNILAHQAWGTILALAFPDTRDLDHPFEFEFFWFQHIMLIVLPAMCIVTRRFVMVPPTLNFIAASYFSMAAFHSILLEMMSIVTAKNLNYMMAPPLGPLELLGQYYRVVMQGVCCLLTFVTRHVLWARIEGYTLKKTGKIE